jgi:hypothetical protein
MKNCGKRVPGRKYDKLLFSRIEECVGSQMQCACSLLNQFCEGRIDFACQEATSQRSSEIAVSSRDHLADDFRQKGIRQDHRKARRVRQLPAMRFHETDAVKQQRFGAPACKGNASCATTSSVSV